MKNFNLHQPDLNPGYAEDQSRPLASGLREARDLAMSRKLETSIFRRQASGSKQSMQADQFPAIPGNREDG